MLRSSIKIFSVAKTFAKLQQNAQSCVGIHRWVAPTLRELRRRQRLMGEQPPQPRSGFVDWNLKAELFAFSKRLKEDFQLPLLQTAFTERSYVLKEQHRLRELGIEETDISLADNHKMAEQGLHLSKEYIDAFLQHELPKVPEEGRQAFLKYMLSTDSLAHIATNLGMKELILTDTYPPTTQNLANSLLAVIGALAESSGIERAFLFIRDFICTQLNQRDLTELWEISDPVLQLKTECEKHKLATPEPRLIGDCGKKTLLAAYHVGIYTNKKLIGSGFGEDVPTAIKTAALDALLRLYGLDENRRPFNFKLEIVPKNIVRHIQSIEQ